MGVGLEPARLPRSLTTQFDRKARQGNPIAQHLNGQRLSGANWLQTAQQKHIHRHRCRSRRSRRWRGCHRVDAGCNLDTGALDVALSPAQTPCLHGSPTLPQQGRCLDFVEIDVDLVRLQFDLERSQFRPAGHGTRVRRSCAEQQRSRCVGERLERHGLTGLSAAVFTQVSGVNRKLLHREQIPGTQGHDQRAGQRGRADRKPGVMCMGACSESCQHERDRIAGAPERCEAQQAVMCHELRTDAGRRRRRVRWRLRRLSHRTGCTPTNAGASPASVAATARRPARARFAADCNARIGRCRPTGRNGSRSAGWRMPSRPRRSSLRHLPTPT